MAYLKCQFIKHSKLFIDYIKKIDKAKMFYYN